MDIGRHMGRTGDFSHLLLSSISGSGPNFQETARRRLLRRAGPGIRPRQCYHVADICPQHVLHHGRGGRPGAAR